ncbi:MAG: C-type lectin domain-containing protein [Myxococcales bacterium]|nr:C-type lectin domain-containing protein [Myxococcales bacterium]
MRTIHIVVVLSSLVSGCMLDRSGTRGAGRDGAVGSDAGTGMDAGRADGGGVDGGRDAAIADAGSDAGGCADGTVDLDRDPTNGCECVVMPQGCDGNDEDCDGVIDEGCGCSPSGSRRDCGSDVGACRVGVQTCSSAGVWGDCVGATDPAPETCNGIDDDCDGTIDMFSRACGSTVGICTMGMETCIAGSFTACSGIASRDEACDGLLDEDCDGAVDEGCECGGADTRPCDLFGCPGVETCSGGRFGSCVIPTPPAETCDGTDEDCNGVIDDGAANCVRESRCNLVRLATGVYLFCFQAPGNDQRRSWANARDYCASFGYHLVTIDDTAEDMALIAAADPLDSGDWWIGINDLDDDGTYTWVGPPSAYRNFRGPPVDGECGVLDSPMSDWESKGCGGGKPFICEAPAP